jgi:hypothetical protein
MNGAFLVLPVAFSRVGEHEWQLERRSDTWPRARILRSASSIRDHSAWRKSIRVLCCSQIQEVKSGDRELNR